MPLIPKQTREAACLQESSHMAAPNQGLLSPFCLFFVSYHLRNATVAWQPRAITWCQYPWILAAALSYFLVTPPHEIAAGNVAAIMPRTQIAGQRCQLPQLASPMGINPLGTPFSLLQAIPLGMWVCNPKEEKCISVWYQSCFLHASSCCEEGMCMGWVWAKRSLCALNPPSTSAILHFLIKKWWKCAVWLSKVMLGNYRCKMRCWNATEAD